MYQRIKSLRKKTQRSVGSVASALQLSNDDYLALERGVRQLLTPELIALSRLYSVSTDYIINLTDEMTPYTMN
ncbi:helix-turn-helix domain-containing protein [Dolosicoccus paucivorans]|uniref:XRE family transcriptional regulator n=1 Tax=Dolosicoccus paucivorans TaxID=84521 RepID=A0A1G8J5X9_9LACT|nr:helix-turn-helix transcriptional regulator [Dolosicoccus paucivorans]PMB84140.1 XRE family transcriptional regulator [Dolosicoccus paucivorans]PMC59100.1 XRE family transcriptional regulator [Dolosicoccus paucivorans]SDI26688.1 hypothetical protein SAMN04487994_100359 [Dolosicoccus paucivorans]